MIQAIKKNIVLVIAAISLVFAGLMLPATASAQNTENKLECGAQINFTGNNCGYGQGTSTIETTIANIINIFSVIVGAVAVIMIIIGGFKYITSGGDSNNIGSAKNTILYAIVGLVIVAIAQAIVQFVLKEV